MIRFRVVSAFPNNFDHSARPSEFRGVMSTPGDPLLWLLPLFSY
jgi:hypothetical protein